MISACTAPHISRFVSALRRRWRWQSAAALPLSLRKGFFMHVQGKEGGKEHYFHCLKRDHQPSWPDFQMIAALVGFLVFDLDNFHLLFCPCVLILIYINITCSRNIKTEFYTSLAVIIFQSCSIFKWRMIQSSHSSKQSDGQWEKYDSEISKEKKKKKSPDYQTSSLGNSAQTL